MEQVEGSKVEKDGERRRIRSKNKKTASSELTTDVYVTTPSTTTTRHPHCLLNLVSTEKHGGDIKQRGRPREKRPP